MTNDILVIAAHPDDEVLGVGGTLLRHQKAGDNIFILILANGESSRDTGVEVEKRLRQATQVTKCLGAKLFLEDFPDNAFDSVPLLKVAKVVEKAVAAAKPTIVYTHHPYDLNLDHRLTFQAVLTACRPQPGFPVEKILAFETLSSTEWQTKDGGNAFCPRQYIDISDFIDQKLEILKIYQDELRVYPHPRSIEGVKILAAYRGLEVGLRFAEAFEVIRILQR